MIDKNSSPERKRRGIVPIGCQLAIRPRRLRSGLL